MKTLLLNDTETVAWVLARVGGNPATEYSSIGVMDDGRIVAGAVFEGYNGRNMLVHMAIDEPVAALSLFKAIARYAFGQLGLSRLTLTAESSNIRAVRLHEKLGAVVEGRLFGAGRDGDDILISRLTPDCKLWRRWNGIERKQSAASPELCGADSTARAVESESVQRDAECAAREQSDAVRPPDLVSTWAASSQ